MCLAMATFILNDALVKLASTELAAGQIMALRGVFVVAIILAAVAIAGQLGELKRMRHPLVLARSALEAMVAFVFITALARMGIAELTAIFLASPLMLTAASAVILKEEVGWRRWTAVGVGFFGMLLVVRPSPAGVDWVALLGLLAAAGAVARDLVTSRIPPGTSSLTIAVGSAASVALLGGTLVPPTAWTAASSTTWGYLLASAVFVTAGNVLLIVAFRSAEASVVSPFRYTSMVWALILGVVIWRELPDGPALAGSALIIGAGLYTIHRERVRARELRAPSAHQRGKPQGVSTGRPG
jgi:drug/metabolite transporter (DMT)-like permease